MARYRTVIDSPKPREELFPYLADFSNAAEWDPGVVSATRADDGEVRIGSAFDLVAAFMGRETPLRYVVTALDPPRSVTFRGENSSVVSLDTITFADRPEGTRVTYDADLQLKGARKIGDPVLRLLFGKIGDKARDGLRELVDGRIVR
jgi:carbon monoxide dehydrogenase subunit G